MQATDAASTSSNAPARIASAGVRSPNSGARPVNQARTVREASNASRSKTASYATRSRDGLLMHPIGRRSHPFHDATGHSTGTPFCNVSRCA